MYWHLYTKIVNNYYIKDWKEFYCGPGKGRGSKELLKKSFEKLAQKNIFVCKLGKKKAKQASDFIDKIALALFIDILPIVDFLLFCTYAP